MFFPANSGRSGANRRKEPHDDRSPSYAVRDGDMAAGPVTSSHVKKLEETAMKMCRWACGHTLRVHVRNDNNRDRLKVACITERCRKARLMRFDHVKRRYQDYIGRNTLDTLPPGRRMRGRRKQRWVDCVNRVMRAIGTRQT